MLKPRTTAVAGILMLLSFVFTACQKEAGEGGTSSISGKVYVFNVNGAGETIAEYYGADYDVYIIYGNEDEIYDDKFATSLDGSYRFTNLVPGEYTVFAYSECDACPSGINAVKETVTIDANKQDIVVPDLIIFE